jgi:outer membrane receptor for ferrienterochelin and colicins
VVVRSGAIGAMTDDAGEARLSLPAGPHVVGVSRLGFHPESLTVTLRAGQDTMLAFAIREQAAEVERVIVSATRADRRIEDLPIRVEAISREEIEEKMLMTPGDISMLLNETGGLRVQTTSPSLGGANVRVQGLRGRYTLILSDGLPLFGAQTGGLGLLQIPPMDLGQVEVIKGVASALYGSSALGGVINLVTRRPHEQPEREVLLNQTTRTGTDVVLWTSQRLSERWGMTLLAGGHRQSRVDVDTDGWTDIPGHRRAVVRPRLFWQGANGRNALFTVGTTLEARSGGTLAGQTAPDGFPFAEALDTRRFDAGTVVRLPFRSSILSVRASAASQHHDHHFGGVRERDRHETVFTETSLATSRGRQLTVLGAAVQRERYVGRDVSRFDYTYTIPAAFVQHDAEPAPWVVLSASGRVDAHSEYGTRFDPRVSALARLPGGWTLRASGGTGSFAPTPFTEETEVTGLSPLQRLGDLRAERALGASLDAGVTLTALELSAALFASRITDALLVRESGSGTLELVNATLPTRTVGADFLARLRVERVTATATYTYVRSTDADPETVARRRVALTPEHAAGLVAVWEDEETGRIGLEAYYTGRQALEHNPYRSTSESYVLFGAIAERRFGRARLFINLENLGDVRMSKHQPLVRPSRGAGGRWTTDAWAPLEGRVINAGIRLDVASAPRDEDR